jgi:phosphoribosyl 1,2-cyclic phosphate phosphodiesterase
MGQATFYFLGTGASTGIPVIGCPCDICHSSSPFNKRCRVSALIQIQKRSFLIDAGPDLRLQLLRANLQEVSGLLLTHTHFDHIAGLDDLRPLLFRRKGAIPCLLSQDSLDELKIRYHYLMQEYPEVEVPYTQLKFQLLEGDFGKVDFQGLSLRYVSYLQMGMKVTGYLIGNLAYISDIRNYSQRVIEDLKGIDILILGALRDTPAQGHFSLDEAIAFSREVGAKETFFTHIGHELDHETTNQKLPSDIRLAYDGLELSFEAP